MAAPSRTITFVTWNGKKLEAFRQILGPDFPHKVVSSGQDLPEYQGTPQEVVTEKYREAARRVEGAVIVAALGLFGYCVGKGGEVKVFKGRMEGVIVSPPRGARDCGWDPIFQPSGHELTYAELLPEIKNSILHRGRAVAKLTAFLTEEHL